MKPWDWIGDGNGEVCKKEEDERHIPPEFDMYEAGSSERLRLLDGFLLYSKDGQLAPLQALDDPSTRKNVIVYGSVVEPMHPDILVCLQKMEKHTSGGAIPFQCHSSTSPHVQGRYKTHSTSHSSTMDHRRLQGGGGNDGTLQIKNGGVESSNLKIRIKLGNLEPGSAAAIPAKRDKYKGHSIRDVLYAYRHCGVVFYYNERAPLDHPVEYEGCNMRSLDEGPDDTGFDRVALTYNSKVDTFCQTTVKWYGSKVVGISNDNSKVLIHFFGWKKQFDEYVDRRSYRLAAYGTHSTARTDMEILTLSRKERPQTCIYCPPSRRRRVQLSDVQYWCTDYTVVESPILWLVTNCAWYRVKGGDWWNPVEPSHLYCPTFESVSTSFHLMGLFLPILRSYPGSSLCELANKLEQESDGQFCFADVVESHSFIMDQLEQLGPLRGTLPATEEAFSKQLLAAGKVWESSGASVVHVNKLNSSGPCNRLATRKTPFDECSSSSTNTSTISAENPLDSLESSTKDSGGINSGLSHDEDWEGGQHHVEIDPIEAALAAAEEERLRQEALTHLPCPDNILWKALSINGEPSLPPPSTSPVSLVLQNPQFEEAFLEDLITSWSFLHMFGSLFDAPSCTLEELMKALCSSSSYSCCNGTTPGVTPPPQLLKHCGGGGNGSGTPKQVIPTLITCIHMRLVDFILQDQVKANTAAGIELHGDPYWERYFFSCQASGDPDVPNPGAGGGNSTRSALRRPRTAQSSSYPTTTASSSIPPYGMNAMSAYNATGVGPLYGSPSTVVDGLRGSWELLRSTPMGWLELTRLMYFRKEGINPKKLFDPLGECRLILRHAMDETMKSDDMKSFVKLKPGTGSEIARPPPDGGPVKDLNMLWSRLESGWYDFPPDVGELSGGGGAPTVANPLPTLKKPKIEMDDDLCHASPADSAVLKGGGVGICSSSPHMRKGSTPSRDCECYGPEGFIHDVKDMAAFYTSTYGETAPVTEQASSIVEDITSLFKNMVELPMRQLEQLEVREENDDGGDLKGEEVVTKNGSSQRKPDNIKLKGQKAAAGDCPVPSSSTKTPAANYKLPDIMSTLEYEQWPVVTRVQLLRWLCDEASATETFHSLCDSVLSSGEGLKCKNKEARSLVKAMRSSRRSMLHDSGDPTQHTDSELLATVLAQEDNATKAARAVADLRVRLSPLGSDRLHRRYWLLDGKEPIYVEDRNGKWLNYVGEDSIKALVQWLDVRGTREGHLRKVIVAFLVENYGIDVTEFSKPPMNCRKRKSSSALPRMSPSDLDGIEVNWQMKDDVAFQQRDTLKYQCRKLVLSPSVLAPAFHDAYATSVVLLTFKVLVGPGGLGIGLSQRHSSVIVAEFTSLHTSPNPAQMAGICIGDELVSIGSVMALSSTQVASSVRETISLALGQRISIKVLRLVQLIDYNNQPGAAATQYGGMLHAVGTLLARESMLAHPYVLGESWNNIHRHKWRQQMVAAVESADNRSVLINGQEGGNESLNTHPTALMSSSAMQENRKESWNQRCGSHRCCSSSPNNLANRPQDVDDELQNFLIHGTDHMHIKQRQCCGAKMVVQCLLQLEAVLTLQGTMLHPDRGWTPARRRKWRAYTAEASTAAQLLVSWASLDGIVEWGILEGVTRPIKCEKFLELIQSGNQNQIPKQSDMVIYFGAGHVLSCKLRAKLGLRLPWGGDDPIPNATFLYRVVSVTYESSGPPSMPERCEPFVILELEVVRPSRPPPQAVLLPPISKKSRFSRLLMRALR